MPQSLEQLEQVAPRLADEDIGEEVAVADDHSEGHLFHVNPPRGYSCPNRPN